MCSKHMLLLFVSDFDKYSSILSTLNVSINKEKIELNSYASYNADVVKHNTLQEKTFKSVIERKIPISYCPFCGRKLN